MTVRRIRRLVRRRPVAAALIAGLLALNVAWGLGRVVCPMMSMSECLLAATLVVFGGSMPAIAVRATWLAAGAHRAVARLPRTHPPPALREAAGRLGLRQVRCLRDPHPTAFCAGILRPRIHLATGTVAALSGDELDAVLAHEAAHARRHDPLRRLLARAAADVCFYLPLARWWSHRQTERAELHADRTAINRVGAQAVAGALLTTTTTTPPTTTSYGGATDARIAQLLGDHIPIPRPTPAQVITTLGGLVTAIWLTMCLTQAALAHLGLS